jgi:hypothetical protein
VFHSVNSGLDGHSPLTRLDVVVVLFLVLGMVPLVLLMALHFRLVPL